MAVAGLDSLMLPGMLPAVLGAAMLLPAAEATLRLHPRRDHTDPPMTVTPDVDDLLQRVIEQDLDMRADLDLELFREISRTTASDADSTTSSDSQGQGQGQQGLDTWSVVWYCGMFAAFTSLFLIMPCSQVLCRSGLLQSDPRLRPRTALAAFPSPSGYGTPPPPYKQFAPPSYEDVILDLQPPGKAVPVLPAVSEQGDDGVKQDKKLDGAGAATVVLDVYVIPLRPEASAVPGVTAEA